MKKINKLLGLDIETHRGKEWDELTEQQRRAFENHPGSGSEDVISCYNEIAGLHAEFSQVICCSLGYVDKEGEIKLLSIHNKNEVDLLTRLAPILNKFEKSGYAILGHNIGGCDIPYLIKRYIINHLPVPMILKGIELKPWEREDVDTMTTWKFGSWSNTSLEVICSALGIQVKTSEISGQTMYLTPLKDLDMDKVAIYCEEDVMATMKVYMTIIKYYDGI